MTRQCLDWLGLPRYVVVAIIRTPNVENWLLAYHLAVEYINKKRVRGNCMVVGGHAHKSSVEVSYLSCLDYYSPSLSWIITRCFESIKSRYERWSHQWRSLVVTTPPFYERLDFDELGNRTQSNLPHPLPLDTKSSIWWYRNDKLPIGTVGLEPM